MTREEAIVDIRDNIKPVVGGISLDMAIEALGQQPCKDWHDVPSDEMTLEQARQAVKDLRKKLAEYLEKNRENLINQRATTCRHGGHCEWVACDKCNHYEPDVLNQQPCDDCISRQAVDELSKELVHTTKDKADFLCNFWEGLQKLPTVTPKEKIIHCKVCKYRDYWGDCTKWSKELDAHKTYLLDENMFCGFAERK